MLLQISAGVLQQAQHDGLMTFYEEIGEIPNSVTIPMFPGCCQPRRRQVALRHCVDDSKTTKNVEMAQSRPSFASTPTSSQCQNLGSGMKTISDVLVSFPQSARMQWHCGFEWYIAQCFRHIECVDQAGGLGLRVGRHVADQPGQSQTFVITLESIIS